MPRAALAWLCACCLLVASLAAGCAEVQLARVDPAPSLGPLGLEKVLVFTVSQDPALARSLDYQVARRLEYYGLKVWAARDWLADDQLGQAGALGDFARQVGAQQVLVTGFAPPEDAAPSGDWPTALAALWEAAQRRPFQAAEGDQGMFLEIHGVDDGRLLWRGVTQPLKGASFGAVVAQAAESMLLEMERLGILRYQPGAPLYKDRERPSGEH